MAKVTIEKNGVKITVNETSPGLFGKLGYTYISGGTTYKPKPTKKTPIPTRTPTRTTQPVQTRTTPTYQQPRKSPAQLAAERKEQERKRQESIASEVERRRLKIERETLAKKTKALQPPTVNLQPGDRGENVRQLQNYLVSQGYMTQAEMDTGPGIFGPRTKKAVTGLQQARGVDNTTGQGFYGPRTRAGITQQQGTQPQARTQAPIDTSSILEKTGSSITPTSLNPVTTTNFQQTPPPVDVAVPPTPKPPAPMSEIDKRLQAESDKALQASEASAGRSAFQAEQDIQAGIPEQEKLIRELSERIQSIGDQATGAKLKAEDRLAPQFAIAGEQASIERSRAIQVLTLQSKLSAAQGNLQNAIDLSDRAVEAKFGPIEAKLNTSLRNLNIIRNSPKFTASQKKKAEATAERKAEELAQVALEKADAKAVSDFTAQIIAKNPTIDAVTLEALSKAKNIVEATQLATNAELAVGGEEFTSTQNLKLEQAGLSNAPRQDKLDFLYGKEAGGTTPTIDLSPEDNRNLTGAGLTPTDIQNIQSDVAEFGIDAVLEGIPDQTQKNAIKKVYGVVEPTKSVAEQISSFLNKAKDAGLSRKEAKAKIKTQLEKKFGTLTRARKNEIEDELVKVFGQTFWQGIVPGGR